MNHSLPIRNPRPRGGMVAKAAAFAPCLAALLAFAGAAHAEPWPLERVLDRARQVDPSITAAHAGGDLGRAQASQMWAMLSPHLTASSGFTRTDDPAVLFSQKLWQGRFGAADFAIPSLNQPDAQSAIQYNLTLDQPLFNGGRELTAPFVSSHYRKAATAMEQAQVATRLIAVVESYVQALQAREGLKAAELSLAAASTMRAAAVERWRMGQVPELDTLRAAAREAQARVGAIGARRGLAVAVAHLSKIVKADVSADDLVVPAPDAFAPVPERAGASRAELTAAREAAKATGSEAVTTGLRLLPSLNSRFAVSNYKPWSGGEYERRWMVAVMAELPLFDGAQRLNEWRAARAKATQARATAEALERDMATGLAAARTEDAVARERADAARAGRAAAEEALRLSALRYRAGLLPLSELLAADAEASGARASEVDASGAVILAHYRLLHAMGDLR